MSEDKKHTKKELRDLILKGFAGFVNKDHYTPFINALYEFDDGKATKAESKLKAENTRLKNRVSRLDNLVAELNKSINDAVAIRHADMKKLSEMETSRNTVANQLFERDQKLIEKEKRENQFIKIIENLSKKLSVDY